MHHQQNIHHDKDLLQSIDFIDTSSCLYYEQLRLIPLKLVITNKYSSPLKIISKLKLNHPSLKIKIESI